ncbi:hypothetical protein [Ilumatobacter nonamiensis]|uniref:hypothetical protein n=1 Tax=Ilumatobacter nonamiensis TaxID=467093 RepID=UPI00034A0FA0|nr:hypothetical protein [Ilumatobacter nonamiensis]
MVNWSRGPETAECAAVVRAAIEQRHLDEDVQSVVFHDMDLLSQRFDALRSAFPVSTLHAVAIKANPLVEVLKHVVGRGAGLEAASIEEVEIALAAGCDPSRIVFDSPAKTAAEICRALDLGVMINADNVAELRRLADLRRADHRSVIGVRVNPMVGVGRIATTSVAGTDSKFGIPLDRARAELPALLEEMPWITALHVHVGSQGCSLDQLLDSAVAIEALRVQLNGGLGTDRIDVVDLGGGLPSVYTSTDDVIAPDEYANALRRLVPSWFDGTVRLVTEFGRVLQAHCGWAVSRVEYVKRIGDARLAVVHLGADLLLRAVYRPEDWSHRLASLDASGEVPTGDPIPWTVGGPLCFAGDIIGRDVPLVDVRAGSLVLIRDIGAYTMSMWSRHCSRGLPLVLGHAATSSGSDLSVIRRAESPGDVAAFWSVDGGRGASGPGEDH